MKKNNSKKIEEFIRVDHAGERGAIKIYEGQLLALKTICKDPNLQKTIEEMKIHEKEHCDFFEQEIKKRNIKPTKFLPLWDLLGVGLGFGSTILGKKAAMLCTASVEEVIDDHYKNQIDQIGSDENNLKNKITKFRNDEIHHKDTIYNKVDLSNKELDTFFDSMTQGMFAKIKEFFDTMPKLRHVIEIKNPKTKKKSEVILEGLESFLV